MKELILMTFTKGKIYEQKTLIQEEFFTICQQFDNFAPPKSVKSISSTNFIEQFQEQQQQQKSQIPSNQIKQQSIKQKSFNLNEQNLQIFNNLRKTQSLTENFEGKKPDKIQNLNILNSNYSYLINRAILSPKPKDNIPDLIQVDFLEQDWRRLQVGGLYCINQKKIKQQKKIIQKVLAKLGQNIIKQKNIMNISLPVTIFKTQSQVTTIARSLTYSPLLLQPECFLNQRKQFCYFIRMKKLITWQLTDNYSQINFQKPFNPILGQTLQIFIDGCPAYFQQISHHPQITYFYFLGRGYSMYGHVEPKVSMGMNHCKVFSHCMKTIKFQNGDIIQIGPNRMIVNGTVIGQRTFNLDNKSFIYDIGQNLLTVITFGPTKRGFFSGPTQALDYFSGKVWRMSKQFKQKIYKEWKYKFQYKIKKEYIQKQLFSYDGIWNYNIIIDGEQYFNFKNQLPYKMIEQAFPLPSDSRYRKDLIELINGNIQKSQQQKQKMEQAQRYDKKLRNQYRNK